ncbi:DNA cytosine methyltransferase [Pantoea sp. SO10]|uniref:DNA cytosine methyltransferase n=1 Tax=Pantoea sp. SO10 TaxID=2575375 RepID=UPI0010C9EE77|nr:DNA cytosine methyltransferase [Pantoea sp. SO10]QCP60985.1 DNA cytosine methyltransferase [Pantoea sp. SO10]
MDCITHSFTAIDLFCGAGGLTCGLKQAGFKVIAGVELNPVAAQTYRINHPEDLLLEQDIAKVNRHKLMKELNLKPGELDLLAGCPPCQGFSSHRTRNQSTAVEDDRNDLIFELMKFTKKFLPKVIMIENVPALAKDDRINKVIFLLKKLNYKINEESLQVKDTANYGVPQRRKRMILVASRYGFVEHPTKNKEISTVRSTIKDLTNPGCGNDPLHDYFSKRSEKVMEMIRLVPKNGGSRQQLPKEYWLDCHKKHPGGYRDVYGRMAWDKVSPTITGGCINPSKGRFLHPQEDRAITLREAALLQTFPHDYIFSLEKGRDAAALMIGNALPPKFIFEHAIKIKKHLESIIK